MFTAVTTTTHILSPTRSTKLFFVVYFHFTKMATDRIKVLARIRPLLNKEIQRGDVIITEVTDENTKIRLESRSSCGISRNYKLDAILSENDTQSDVFSHVQPLLGDLLEGFNCSLFTYGQTGTGKTHTMLGYDLWSMAQQTNGDEVKALDSKYPEISRDEEHMGIIPRAMLKLFEFIQANGNQIDFHVYVSYIEIYNEKICDLEYWW